MCWWLLLLLVMLENFLLCTLKSGFLAFVSRVFSSLPYPSLSFWLLCAAFLHRWHRCSLTPTIAILWVWKSIWNVCLSSGTLIGLCFQNSPKRHIYALSEIIINMFCASFTCQAYFGWEASMNAIEMKCHSVERNASAPTRTRTHTHTPKIYIGKFSTKKNVLPQLTSSAFPFSCSGSQRHGFPIDIAEFCFVIQLDTCDVHNSKILRHVNHEVLLDQF